MSKRNSYVLASLNGATMMCVVDDPRLENGGYTIIEGKFVKDKVKTDGKKVLGTFETSKGLKYKVYTSKKAELI